ncbi:type VI secretion protein IcmF/TssM N-terminal domain-containing protein [Larsenimonas rhizosphaerae]|uniref:ImcF-like protein n=1 Tax=Larsenimonas rhizosphaerae TaxID=2944682 RepID=A0AA41ZFB2_9GAMM|nr:type VI secretion protein IcmF/TssM N-terminal domain-containing protein [Larsenimonas rhizosphaerae]MCM2130791.1 ImcF-like protein [Larsenimonas rhizosphaerae]MCX2523495.1 ImcF-like protein [Larsenimonas rhizosphaerae]
MMRFLRFLRLLKGFWALAIVLWLAGLVMCVLLLPLITQEREQVFIAMALVTAVWLLAVVLRQYHRIRSERNIENLVELEVHREAADSEPGDYQVLRERLKHALSMQRASRSVEGGRASLYALPWYLVVGMSSAGKTSLLTRSPLSATMAGGSQISAVSGTQHCDWYFSREAVMIDTAGRYLTDDRPASEFADFLKTLRKQRSRPAINGLVLVVSLPDLLKDSRQQAHALAEQLVSRVDEYRDCLRLNPPIYLFFSKADLLPGFTRTFESLDAAERQRPWGITFSLEELRQQGVIAAFQQRFPHLVDQLRTTVDRRVMEEGLKADSELLRFCDYFAELSGVLSDFLEQFDSQLHGERAPVLRGLYFTSALQGGPALPALLDEQTRHDFALEQSIGVANDRESQGEKSYFIAGTFRDVIFADRNLSLYYSRHGNRRALPPLLIGAAGLLGVAAIAAQGWSAWHNHQWIDGISHTLEQKERGPIMNMDRDQRLALLEDMQRQLTTIEQYRQQGVPLQLDMGLYQGDAMRDALMQAWGALLKAEALAPLQIRLARQLRDLDVLAGRHDGLDTRAETTRNELSANESMQEESGADERPAQVLSARGQAIGNSAVSRMEESSTERAALGSVPTSLSEVGSRVRSEARSRTTDSARDAWYSARSDLRTEVEEGIRQGGHVSGELNGNKAEASGVALTSGQQRGPSLSEEMLTRLDQADIERLIEGYSSLQLYLILTDPDAHEDQADFVATALPRLLTDMAERKEIALSRESIVDSAALYVHFLQLGEAPALERNKLLVADTRANLNAFLIDSSLVDREYLRYQLEAEKRFDPLTLSRMVPDMSGRLLYASRAVPALYTHEVWEQYLRPEIIKTVSGDLDRESDWVLDDENTDDAVQSKARFVSQLMARYKRDYAKAWERFLGSTHVSQFDTLDQASNRLAQYSDLQTSPLRQVLRAVDENTRWDSPRTRDEQGDQRGHEQDQGFWARVTRVFGDDDANDHSIDLTSLPRINDGTLARHFRPVSRLLAADEATGSDDSVINQYLLDLRQLKNRIDNIRGAQDTGRSSKLLIMETLAGQSSEINTLHNFIAARVDTSRMPLVASLQPLFRTPVDNTRKALDGPARAQLNGAWNDQVHTPWQQMIAGRYPVADSINEASVRDLSHFIDPDDGLLSKFRHDEIGDLAGSGSGQRSNMVDPRMLKSIDNATELGRVIDSLSDLQNGFELQINPTSGLTEIVLTLDGQTVRYRNNSQHWERMIWPGGGRSSGARMDIINRNGERHTVFDYPGRWGFLRMIDSAHITSLDRARQRFEWRTWMGAVSFDVRNFGGVRVSDLKRIKALSIPGMGQ